MDTRRTNVGNEQLSARRKAARMLITVVVAFAVCYFPVHLLNILRYIEMKFFLKESDGRYFHQTQQHIHFSYHYTIIVRLKG